MLLCYNVDNDVRKVISEMSISEIIERIRSEYSEIDWLKSRSNFYKIPDQGIFVQYNLKDLEKNMKVVNF